MAKLTVLTYPNKKLREKALPVNSVTPDIIQIVNDMFETMYAEQGIGLAATQVGIALRIIVVNVTEDKNAGLCLINPEIIFSEGEQYESEGCLSLPEAFDKVKRFAKIKVRALNQANEMFEMDAEGLLAVCIQHEIDHLNGILFIDHLSKLKRERLQKKMQKAQKFSEEMNA